MGKRLEKGALAALRAVGQLGALAPEPPRASGGYGLACRGALTLLFLIGLVVSLWLPGPGLTIMLVATVALLQFFVLQYRGTLKTRSTMLWLAAVAAICGAVVAVVWRGWSGRNSSSGDVMVLATVLTSFAALPFVRSLFTTIFGPHHPESPLPEPDGEPSLWFWTGAVGPDRATITARVADRVSADSVVVRYRAVSCRANESLFDGQMLDRAALDGQMLESSPVEIDRYRFATVELRDLQPDQRYELWVEPRHSGAASSVSTGPGRTGTSNDAVLGSFATFPLANKPATVRLAFGSCMSTGSKGAVFDTIANLSPKPHLFMVTGDLHYENITAKQPERFLAAFDKVHRSYPQRRLYNSMPMAYVWDDHDYGDNDSGCDSPSKSAAQKAYRVAVPSYIDRGRTGHADQTGAINQEFTIGRVRVVVTDNRSERGELAGHLLSPTQEQWLIGCITDPAWPVVLWVSSTPWISNDTDSDNWGAYPDQRRRIADAIGDRAANLFMVSGDAHMAAIDDGSNSAYSSGSSTGGESAGARSGGFPVLQAAALDRLGSAKGGRFSHGKFAGAGQFGLVTIDDRGHEIEVTLSAQSWSGSEIAEHSFKISP